MKRLKKILIFSDIHLTADSRRIIGLDPLERLQFALNHALDNHSDAEHIVFSGDLAHDANASAYRSLKELTENIKIPITFMMGNHDRRETFSQIFPHVYFDDKGFLQSRLSVKSHELIFLDTLCDPSSSSNKHAGLLCSQRLAWLDTQLAAVKKKKVIIFMHHPAFRVGFKAMDRIRLANSKSFFSVLDRYKNVIHIISGHIHRTISGHVNGYGFSIFKSTCHQMPMQCDSDNVKLSTVEPGAYGILFLQPRSLVVHTEDFGLQEKKKRVFDNYS